MVLVIFNMRRKFGKFHREIHRVLVHHGHELSLHFRVGRVRAVLVDVQVVSVAVDGAGSGGQTGNGSRF